MRIRFLLVLLCIFLCLVSCDTAQNPPPEEQIWSCVYTPTEITLPDGWYFDQRAALSYDTLSAILTAEVHYELPPLDESGFIPFIYGTASFTSDGTLISIQSENEEEAPSYNEKDTTAVKTDLTPMHDGADIWMTKTQSDGTTASVEALYTEYDAGLWVTLTDADGGVLCSVEPAALFGYDISRDIGAQYGGEIFSVQDIASVTDSSGRTLYCLLTTEGFAAVNTAGQPVWISDVRNIRSVIPTEEHGMLLLCADRNTQTLTVLDADTGRAQSTVSMDADMQTDGDSVTLFVGGDGTLYAQNRRGIWSLTFTTDDAGKVWADARLLLDFTLSEIAAAEIAAAAALDEKTFYLVMENDTSEEEERSYLYRYDYVLPEDVIVKEEIVLARLGTHLLLEQVVRDFNKSSDTHRIVIRDYTGYTDDESRRLALDTDIVSDDIPDLFLIGSGLSDLVDVYSDAGVFADLKPIIPDYDSLLGCVTAPFETVRSDGSTAQYILPLSYSITTVVGHPEDFGDAVYASVTAEEMLAYYRNVPDGQYILHNCYDLQKYLLWANIDGYYDTNSAVCTFADGDLAGLMDGSQSIYDSAEYLGGDISTTADFHDDFRNGTLRLHEVAVSSLPAWVRLNRALGDFTPIGYPNHEGRHYARIGGRVNVAVSSQTAHTAEITEFLALWFARNTAHPYDRALLYTTDIDAELAQYHDQTFIENGENSGYVHDSFAADRPGLKYKLTDGDADSLRAFLNAIDARVRTDTPAAEIFWEEFSDRGTKDWNTVLEAAQSRCAIYLSEQMD